MKILHISTFIFNYFAYSLPLIVEFYSHLLFDLSTIVSIKY